MEEKPRMSSKACIPHYFQAEDWKLTGTRKNKIQTPNCDLGLPPLPLQTHLLSLSSLLTVQGLPRPSESSWNTP